MSAEVAAAVHLIAVPIAFSVAFLELGRAFDYPSILRKEPDEILRRFEGGGTGLLLRWHALLVNALAMLPLVALVAVVIDAPPALMALSIVIGATAALVQALGLVRWTFAVPELARRYVAAHGPEGESTRKAIEVTFSTLHRLLGVRIGEHLGYLLTGSWTLLVPHRSSRRRCSRAGSAWWGCRSASLSSSARLSSLGRMRRMAGRSPARSCRSPTSPGRSGSWLWAWFLLV